MTTQDKLKAAEERIKELKILVKHLKKKNLFLSINSAQTENNYVVTYKTNQSPQ